MYPLYFFKIICYNIKNYFINEGNLLKALILYVAQLPGGDNLKYGRSLPSVYHLLALNDIHTLDGKFELLSDNASTKLPYSLFLQASDTVKSGGINSFLHYQCDP